MYDAAYMVCIAASRGRARRSYGLLFLLFIGYILFTRPRLVRMRVTLQGLSGVGVEIAKNLVLAGPKSVTLFDPTPCVLGDLGRNFYVTEQDVKENKTRAEACVAKLQKLNPYVQVSVAPASTTSVTLASNCDVLVLAEALLLSSDAIERLNNECRRLKAGMILVENAGLAAKVFVDFGGEFVVRDANRQGKFVFDVLVDRPEK